MKVLTIIKIIICYVIFDSARLTALENPYEPPQTILRKSISYYEGIIKGKSVSLPEEVENDLVLKLNKTLTLDRFDYNPIPVNLQTNLTDEIANVDSLTLDELGRALDKVFVPEIVKILKASKELRAKKFVTSEERNNFLTNKAKEIGVTADDIEKVMNAAYVYIPFISNYGVAVKGDKVIVSLNGGIIWYNVATVFSPPRVVPVTQKTNRAFGIAKNGKIYIDIKTKRPIDAVQYATNSAIKAFSRNLEAISKDIPEFRLSADVFSAFGNKSLFKLGKKEGIRVDDKFNVVEFYEDEDGIRRPKNVGCVLVSKVADNKDTTKTEIVYSSARNIIGTAEPGMTLLERPRMPIDVLIGYSGFPNSAWGLNVEFDYNMGRYMGISQLYIPISLLVSEYSYGGETEYSLNEIGTGLIKKFYWKRLSFGLQGGAKMHLKTNEFRPEVDGILEFRLSPDIVIGGRGGYSFGNWLKGVAWSAHVGYNPPTLPFDPFDAIRGLLGI